jgi:hypothetical protein
MRKRNGATATFASAETAVVAEATNVDLSWSGSLNCSGEFARATGDASGEWMARSIESPEDSAAGRSIDTLAGTLLSDCADVTSRVGTIANVTSTHAAMSNNASELRQ